MALQIIETTHVRVTCDGCRTATAEVCPKRETGPAARMTAVRKFREVGWHHDPATHRDREYQAALRDGSGRWYCPTCARQTHL